MKTLPLSIILVMGISFIASTNAYGCIYCPAGPTTVHSERLILSNGPTPWYDRVNGWVWVGIAASAVTGTWALLFRRLKE